VDAEENAKLEECGDGCIHCHDEGLETAQGDGRGPATDGTDSGDLSARERIEGKLLTKRGREAYKYRKVALKGKM